MKEEVFLMTTAYRELDEQERKAEIEKLQARYDEYKARGLNLNMARGKPSPEQLDAINPMIGCIGENDYRSRDGLDLRNYSGIQSLPEINEVFAEILHVPSENVLVYGNGSLGLMYDTFLSACIDALPGAEEGWFKSCGGPENVKVLCPCPGYDRHFRIAEKLGTTLIPIKMTENGPDMDAVEEYCQDPNVKAMWLVPVYSNPQGYVCSDETYERLVNMETAADFRVFLDHAYGAHHLTSWHPQIPRLLDMAKEAGHPNRFVYFASTSKITFASAGIAAMAGSTEDMEWYMRQLSVQSIGPDKIQQLRHVRFFEQMGCVEEIMKKHRDSLRPKFHAVLSELDQQLSDLDIADWTKPKGGYFISVDLMDGTAKRTWDLCKEAGVILTKPGATFPYGKDPQDSNIRIAPSFPPVEELEMAIKVFCTAARLAALEKLEEQA